MIIRTVIVKYIERNLYK